MVNVLEPKVKKDLLAWFVKLQLSEYVVLFADDQEVCTYARFLFYSDPMHIDRTTIILISAITSDYVEMCVSAFRRP